MMGEWLNPQGAILVVGVLVLVLPYVQRLLSLWVGTLMFPATARTDFEKRTAGELIDLKNRLEKEGHGKAAVICRDLIVAVLYGDSVRPQEPEPCVQKPLFR
jgi:hypothetical protein